MILILTKQTEHACISSALKTHNEIIKTDAAEFKVIGKCSLNAAQYYLCPVSYWTRFQLLTMLGCSMCREKIRNRNKIRCCLAKQKQFF